jgi:RHS repeat-associated protein
MSRIAMGLDYFGMKYFSGPQGRFTSPDPIGIMKQKALDPQQWNAYAYVRNNPLRLVDENRKWPTEIHNKIIQSAFPGSNPGSLAAWMWPNFRRGVM